MYLGKRIFFRQFFELQLMRFDEIDECENRIKNSQGTLSTNLSSKYANAKRCASCFIDIANCLYWTKNTVKKWPTWISSIDQSSSFFSLCFYINLLSIGLFFRSVIKLFVKFDIVIVYFAPKSRHSSKHTHLGYSFLSICLAVILFFFERLNNLIDMKIAQKTTHTPLCVWTK